MAALKAQVLDHFEKFLIANCDQFCPPQGRYKEVPDWKEEGGLGGGQ